MSSAADLQDITSRIEVLLQEIRAIEGSPSQRPVRSKLQFDGSPGPSRRDKSPSRFDKSPSRRLTFTSAQNSPYHSACILPPQKVDDITAEMKKELLVENEKRRKLEQSLLHVQEELDKTKAMADDVNQSKRLALAMLKQLHNEYTKLQRKHQQSIRNSRYNENIQRSQDSALAVQERRLTSLSQQLQSEVCKRLELENRLNREINTRSFLEETLNETLQQKDRLEDQIRHKQMELHAVSSDEIFHDCQEGPQAGTPEQKKLQNFKSPRQSVNQNESLLKITSDKSVNASNSNFDSDELIRMKNRCAELEKQLIETSTVSQELNAAKKRCNELELQLKEYTTVSTELNEYRERLQKNVQQLHDVQCAFTQLQDAFKSAQTESNMRLEEKEKLITNLKENESLMNTENEILREIVKDLNALAQSYLERIQDLWNKKIKQEEVLEQTVKELQEKEKSVSESDYELKVMCKKCTEQEKQIKELQKAVNLLEDKYGHLTVESATYACENVVRQERLEDDIEQKREVLKDIEKQLENKNKTLDRQAYTIVQLRCRILKQDREIERLQAEIDRLYQDNMRNEEAISTHMNCSTKMKHLVKERDNATQYAKYTSNKLQILKKIIHMYLKKERKIFYFLKHQIIKKHRLLIQRKLQQIQYSDTRMYHDLKQIKSALLNKRGHTQ